MPSSNIDKLSALTAKLMFEEANRASFFEVAVKNGKVIGFTLFKNDAVCIARSFGEQETFISMHGHPGTEWFGLYSGKVKIETSKGEVYVLVAGQQVELSGKEQHSCLYLEPSWAWVITMPPDNFPDKM